MIHIIRHKDYDFPIPSGYVTCEVGPLYKGDRPNINYLNPIINELTGIYDVWKNFDDPFVGFCHYHRFFTDKDGHVMDMGELLNDLDCDIIVPFHVKYPDMTIRQSLEKDFPSCSQLPCNQKLKVPCFYMRFLQVSVHLKRISRIRPQFRPDSAQAPCQKE